jgi:hypothetical protein
LRVERNAEPALGIPGSRTGFAAAIRAPAIKVDFFRVLLYTARGLVGSLLALDRSVFIEVSTLQLQVGEGRTPGYSPPHELAHRLLAGV